MADLEKERWERLLKWLKQEHGMKTDALHIEARDVPDAGRGLFATAEIPPSSTLFEIPRTALINVKTVLARYPHIKEGRLTGTQLVSLYLLLHKPSGDADSLDRTFGPYISTLPRDFSSHPLTWLVNRKLKKEDPCESYFLDQVPPSTWESIVKLNKRFWKDWDAVAKFMKEDSAIVASSSRPALKTAKALDSNDTLLDYLWAWLNVNTRCIFCRLEQSPSHPDNFTLCPILDFANHGTGLTHIFPVTDSDIWGSPKHHRRDSRAQARTSMFTFLGSSDYGLAEGQELLLKYGAHPNRFLFTEYGFVNPLTDGAVATSTYSAEVDVQDLVEELIEKTGSVAPLIKSTLDEGGYWGDWTLHSSPNSAFPSWRLISALRLICALERYSGETTMQTRLAIDSWLDVTNGSKDIISRVNEDAWRKKLLWLCETVRYRARKDRVSALDAASLPQGGSAWVPWQSESVRILWKEELEVAEAVLASIQAGVEF
ncbi:SET domain-containing protein [Trametes versicolor FP-101664 SS1]|uniref:SET domain-containing protein n=1 Tax=Trametes versicolor (strain FP-101664) TaxID=717944 RepID=UPI00046242CF|nr:SET domain-containing protein [Trametes versicolor FP-101664 SS1]EIW60445.1 SET domain-containing protein [Trametes versicolor FP-101664 SS1]